MPTWMEPPHSVDCGPRLRSVGIGLRSAHIAEVLARRPNIGWFEVHAENYMNPATALSNLVAVREYYPLSLHGVALSIGGIAPLNKDHLGRLKTLVERLDPFLVSEHLAWTAADGVHLNDLLPLPYTEESLDTVSTHVLQTQEVLGRRILIENPARYLRFRHATMGETEFLAELVHRTGCGLLCDVSNIYISACNIGVDPVRYVEALPEGTVGEIHLAGHAVRRVGDRTLLIDDHASRVPPGVWSLFADSVTRLGAPPTLIEWDADLPALDVLLEEARKAQDVLDNAAERWNVDAI